MIGSGVAKNYSDDERDRDTLQYQKRAFARYPLKSMPDPHLGNLRRRRFRLPE